MDQSNLLKNLVGFSERSDRQTEAAEGSDNSRKQQEVKMKKERLSKV